MPIHPYATLQYANTLAHVGRPLFVPEWQGHVIVRDWKHGTSDALGTYPITVIAPGSDVPAGVERLRAAGLVSVALVLDGFATPDNGELRRAFSVVRPFKTHYLVDATRSAYQPTRHHRYEIDRAEKQGVAVKSVALADILDDWTALYSELVARHGITGLQQFPRESFATLARCEGLSAVAAFLNDEIVSCHLWFQFGEFVWSHLAATNARGYQSGAAYAVYDHSIRLYAHHLVNLGGAAGTYDTGNDGLARFKAGFSNRQEASYLCGAVLDQSTYDRLCAERGDYAGTYFPAYRATAISG